MARFFMLMILPQHHYEWESLREPHTYTITSELRWTYRWTLSGSDGSYYCYSQRPCYGLDPGMPITARSSLRLTPVYFKWESYNETRVCYFIDCMRLSY